MAGSLAMRLSRRRGTSLVLVLSASGLLMPACKKADVPPEVPKIAAPPDVMVTVSLGHTSAFATRLGRYVDQVSPGAGAQMNGRAIADIMAKMVGASSLDGLDLEQPVRLVVLNPKTHAQHPVLLGTFPDADKLRRGVGTLKVERKEGLALVGGEAEVAAVRDWALGPLAAARAPDAPTAEIWLDRVLTVFRPDLEGAAKNMGALGMGGTLQAVLEAEIKVLIAAGEQSERMTIAFDSTGDEASVDMALVPRAGTTLAGFIGAQKPFDPKFLDALPEAGTSAMVMAGHAVLGDLGEPMYKLIGPFLADVAGRPFDDSFHKAWTEWMARFTGDFAAVSGLEPSGGTAMSEIIGVDDGPAAQKAVLGLFGTPGAARKASIMGIGLTFTATPAAAQHGTASIDTFTMKFDTQSMPELQRTMMDRMYPNGINMAMAGYGKTLAVTMGSQAIDRVNQLIDGAGKAPLSPYVRSVVDAAQKRNDSCVLVMNLAAFMNPLAPAAARSGLAMSFGFADKNAHVRMSMPAQHIAEVTGAIKSSPQFQH
jgi:hypothetical protein